MRIGINVKNRAEGAAIKRALENTETRALVVTMGILGGLSTDRARERVVRFVDDKFDEEDPNYVSIFRT